MNFPPTTYIPSVSNFFNKLRGVSEKALPCFVYPYFLLQAIILIFKKKL